APPTRHRVNGPRTIDRISAASNAGRGESPSPWIETHLGRILAGNLFLRPRVARARRDSQAPADRTARPHRRAAQVRTRARVSSDRSDAPGRAAGARSIVPRTGSLGDGPALLRYAPSGGPHRERRGAC